MEKTKISAIAAIAGKKRVMGKQGGLPWHIPGELKRFKEITTGHPIIMGRKTYDSIGHTLPNRTNIIITRDTSFQVGGAKIAHSLDEALEIAKNEPGNKEIFIIGGQQIFEQAIPILDKLYLTVIDKEIDGDTFFPDYSQFTKIKKDGEGIYEDMKYQFLELQH